MKVFEVSLYWIDDIHNVIDGYLIAESDSTPEGYTDDQIFYYGITPEPGKRYDDFVILSSEENQQ